MYYLMSLFLGRKGPLDTQAAQTPLLQQAISEIPTAQPLAFSAAKRRLRGTIVIHTMFWVFCFRSLYVLSQD